MPIAKRSHAKTSTVCVAREKAPPSPLDSSINATSRKGVTLLPRDAPAGEQKEGFLSHLNTP